MSVVETLPDVEGAMRTWLRTIPAVTAVVAQRVFFGVPKAAVEATFPLVVVQRVGGGDDASEAPIDVALIQLDCWGSLGANGIGDKASATRLCNAVRSACRSFWGPQLVPGVDAAGITVQSVIWLPDPANDRPRYSLTVEVAAISTPE
jgi:hypothetical protein